MGDWKSADSETCDLESALSGTFQLSTPAIAKSDFDIKGEVSLLVSEVGKGQAGWFRQADC